MVSLNSAGTQKIPEAEKPRGFLSVQRQNDLHLFPHSLKQQIKRRFRMEKCRTADAIRFFTIARAVFRKHVTVMQTSDICRAERASRYMTASCTCSTLTTLSDEFTPSKEMNSSSECVIPHTDTHPAPASGEGASAGKELIRTERCIISFSPLLSGVHSLSESRLRPVCRSAAAWN